MNALSLIVLFVTRKTTYLSSIWRERNYPDRFAKASECPNVDYLVDKVKELFPDYKGPM